LHRASLGSFFHWVLREERSSDQELIYCLLPTPSVREFLERFVICWREIPICRIHQIENRSRTIPDKDGGAGGACATRASCGMKAAYAITQVPRSVRVGGVSLCYSTVLG